jgi:hypothetical protein
MQKISAGKISALQKMITPVWFVANLRQLPPRSYAAKSRR